MSRWVKAASVGEGSAILLKGRDRVIPIESVEQALEGLRDVTSARIVADDEGNILEVHVVATSDREAKQIARDIESMLVAKLGKPIDHRKISVAKVDATTEEPKAAEEAPEPVHNPTGESLPFHDRRIEFVGVSVAQAQNRAEARVELAWDGIETAAAVSGMDSSASVHRLVSEATIEAVENLLERDGQFTVNEVKQVMVGDEQTVMVHVSHLEDRHEKVLVGGCPVSGDLARAVALATLNALNRFLGRQKPKEPTEYEIGPASEN